MSKKKGKFFPRLKTTLLCLSLLILASGILIMAPKGVTLVESATNVDSQLPVDTPTPQVAGAQIQPSVQIIGKGLEAPKFSALAVLAYDFDTGQVLYQKDIHKRLFPASTTKVMTALVSVDYYKMGDILEVKPESLVGGSVMGLSVGQRLSYRSLLYGMLLDSGNDAAFTIALNYPGGLNNFVAAMNQRVTALGLTDTHFENPAGFDDPNQYSSAYDLAKISYQAVLNPSLAKVIATKDTEVSSTEGGQSFLLHNLNKLLGEDGVLGIKTGTTEEAGQNFIGLVDKNGHKIITVVLGSNDRFTETKNLIDWVYSNFTWKQVDQ